MTNKFAGAGARTVDDLDRAVRAICRHFETDKVIVIGSQAILVHDTHAPEIIRTSGEIDIYPGNIEEWETHRPGELASEEINAYFGIGSRFHETHGFYIDGVDAETAKFPTGWKERAVTRTVRVADSIIMAIAPSIEDLVISKLHRLDRKDQDFIRACHQMQELDLELIQRRLTDMQPEAEIVTRAERFLETL